MAATHSTTDIATALDLRHAGPATEVGGVGSLDGAGPGELAFSVYEDADPLRETRAGAVICPPTVDPPDGETVVYADSPKLAFVRVGRQFFGGDRPTGVHPTAVVAEGASLGENCFVGPNAYVADCVTVGDDCTIHAGASVGTEGFGFVRDEDEQAQRLPHQGTVRIEDGVEIGANCSIDRAVFEETVLGPGTKLSGQVHLAHHVRTGADTLIASNCGVAGGAVIGDRVMVHPHVSVGNDVTVGDDAELAMNAAVVDDVEPGATVGGSPATRIR